MVECFGEIDDNVIIELDLGARQLPEDEWYDSIFRTTYNPPDPHFCNPSINALKPRQGRLSRQDSAFPADLSEHSPSQCVLIIEDKTPICQRRLTVDGLISGCGIDFVTMSQFDIEILKGGYAMELDPDPEGWIAVATRPFRDGTAKQASIWTAFAIMAIASLISLRKIPWTQQTKRRFHVLPFLALLRATLCYLFIAMQYSFKTHCKTYHLASSRDNGEPDDWQPGAVPGLPRLEMCHANAGLDAFSRRVILILWISELVAYTGNSLSFGFSAFGIITILDRWGSSGSERWEMIANVWQWVAGAGCLAWTVYKMGWRRNAQARKFFEKLVACLIALYAAHGL